MFSEIFLQKLKLQHLFKLFILFSADTEIDFENLEICHEFKNFGLKPVNNNIEEDNTLDGIEYRFDPDIYEDPPEPNFITESNQLILDGTHDKIGIHF